MRAGRQRASLLDGDSREARESLGEVARRPADWPVPVMFVVQYGLYSLLALSAYELFGAMTLGVTFFPPAGLTFASFLVLPKRHWPAIALAIVLGEVTVDLSKDNGFWFSMGWAAANLFEPLVGATVARSLHSTVEFTRRGARAIVIGGLVVGPTVGAAIGATNLRIVHDVHWRSAFADIWIGDGLGVLVVAPVVLMLLVPEFISFPRTAGWPDYALLAALLAVASALFWRNDNPAVGYACIPLLAWPAIRVGARGLAVAAVALATVTTAATARNRGPWEALAGIETHTQLGYQQLFLLAAIGGAWLLTLEVRERTRAVATMESVASDAAILRGALHAGRMGAWTWDSRTRRATWDENLERLYGIEPGTFEGTAAAWLDVLHPDDRERVLHEMTGGLQASGLFRVEHRCVWPDGSVHHMEGIGEVALDESGERLGAFGVAANIDDRKEAEDERTRLLAVERKARERADLRAQVNEVVGYTLDIRELATRITTAVVPALGDWCSLVLTLDDPTEEPITAVASVSTDDRGVVSRSVREFPFDPRSRHRTARVIRTGKTAYSARVDDEVIAAAVDDAAQRDYVQQLGIASGIIVALPGQLGVLGALELARRKGSPAYTPEDVSMVEDLAGTIGAALNSAVLYRRQVRVQRSFDTLQQVTGQLASTADLDSILRTVVRHGAEGLAADSAVLYLLDEREVLVLRDHIGLPDVDTISPWLEIPVGADAPIAEAARTKSMIVLRSLDDMHERYPDMAPPQADEAAMLALPLVIRDSLVGALVFTFRRARTFLDEELSVLETLAGRCAGAIERARLFEEQRNASLTLQRRLLPELPPTPDWLAVGATYEPTTGGEVGGDWYQVMVLDDGRAVAVLGDAVGRGIAAAAAMGQLRAAIAGATAVDPTPTTAIAATNQVATVGADTRCASLAYALLDPTHGTVTYTIAGHPPPVLVRADGSTTVLTDARNPLLGSIPDIEYTAATVDYRPGDTLVLYSDGLVERRGESIDEGVARLATTASSLRHLPPSEMSDALASALVADHSVSDDVAVLIVRREDSTR